MTFLWIPGVKGLKTRSVDITAEKVKLSIKDFFSKCDQIRISLRIWSHLLKQSFIENFTEEIFDRELHFCALYTQEYCSW